MKKMHTLFILFLTLACSNLLLNAYGTKKKTGPAAGSATTAVTRSETPPPPPYPDSDDDTPPPPPLAEEENDNAKLLAEGLRIAIEDGDFDDARGYLKIGARLTDDTLAELSAHERYQPILIELGLYTPPTEEELWFGHTIVPNLEALKKLLADNPQLINKRDELGKTALLTAAFVLDDIKKLNKSNNPADIAEFNKIMSQKAHIIEWLLDEAKANPFVVDADGYNLLMSMITEGFSAPIIEKILKKNIFALEATTHEGKTVFGLIPAETNKTVKPLLENYQAIAQFQQPFKDIYQEWKRFANKYNQVTPTNKVYAYRDARNLFPGLTVLTIGSIFNKPDSVVTLFLQGYIIGGNKGYLSGSPKPTLTADELARADQAIEALQKDRQFQATFEPALHKWATRFNNSEKLFEDSNIEPERSQKMDPSYVKKNGK